MWVLLAIFHISLCLKIIHCQLYPIILVISILHPCYCSRPVHPSAFHIFFIVSILTLGCLWWRKTGTFELVIQSMSDLVLLFNIIWYNSFIITLIFTFLPKPCGPWYHPNQYGGIAVLLHCFIFTIVIHVHIISGI